MGTYGLMNPDQPAPLNALPGKRAPMSGSEARASLEAQRTQCLDKMVEEPDRAKRAVLRQTVSALEVGMASLPADQDQSIYGSYKLVNDAITHYLDRVGIPIERESLVDGLIDGGLRRKPLNNSNATPEEIIDHTKTVVRKSISFFLANERGKKQKLIKELRGKVGLWDWPNGMFSLDDVRRSE